MTYDARNRLRQMDYRQGAAPFLTLNYDYSAVGNRTFMRHISPTQTQTWNFDYDTLSRLKRAAGPHGINTYEYDKNHNRTSMNDINYSVNEADQLFFVSKKGDTLIHDFNGNLVSHFGADHSFTFFYNGFDMLTKIVQTDGSTAEYNYNGDGLRITRKDPAGQTTRYLWSGDEVLKEYSETGATRAQYLLGVGREGIKVPRAPPPLPPFGGTPPPAPADDGWRFYITDALGSVLFLVDSAGNVTDSYEYDEFGNTVRQTGTTPNPYRYTGQQFDPEAGGQYYLRARYYRPQEGRFLSRDPAGYVGGINVYMYVRSSPVNLNDPSGLDGQGNLNATLKYRDYIYAVSRQQGVPAYVLAATLAMELRGEWIQGMKLEVAVFFRPLQKVSVGPGQMKIGTAMLLDRKADPTVQSSLGEHAYLTLLQDPKVNLSYAARYLKHIRENVGGQDTMLTWVMVVSGYNSGKMSRKNYVWNEYDTTVEKTLQEAMKWFGQARGSQDEQRRE